MNNDTNQQRKPRRGAKAKGNEMSEETRGDIAVELHAISEQLRIANLIALTQCHGLSGAIGQSMETLLREDTSGFGVYQLRPDIAEALGVTVDCEVEES